MKVINSILFYFLSTITVICIASSTVLSWAFGLMIAVGLYALGKHIGSNRMRELLGVSYLCKRLSGNILIDDLLDE